MRFRRSQFRAMGSPCALHLYAESEAALDALEATGRAELERLEAKYSRYRDDSLTARINRSAGCREGIRVDEETAALLDYADTAHRESGGRFDLSSGALRRAWDFRSGRLPAPEEVEALLARIGWHRLRWRRPHLVLPIPGMELDFGGLVKEYAADRIAEGLRHLGARHGLVDLGGDLAVVGPHPDASPWIVGVRDPADGSRALASVAVRAGGVATSGDYERRMVIDGVTYGHLLDPRNGWPVRGPASVTVLAPHCLIAGTTSTIAMLSGEAGAQSWLDRVGLPHVRVGRDGQVASSLPLRAPTARPRRPVPLAARAPGASTR